MKCYNHHDRDAFGVCKVCGKGLCLECMEQKDDMVVCAGKHGRSIVSDWVLNIMFIAVAIVCFVAAFKDGFDWFKILLGVFSLSIGVDGFRKAKKK